MAIPHKFDLDRISASYKAAREADSVAAEKVARAFVKYEIGWAEATASFEAIAVGREQVAS